MNAHTISLTLNSGANVLLKTEMQTTDTNFAAFLIDRGYDLIKPVDYSQPKWVYEFDMDEEEEHAQLTIYRRQGFANVCKITQNLIALAHEKPLQPWIAEKWPTLEKAERGEE